MSAFTTDEINAKITRYKSMLTGLEDILIKMQESGDVQEYQFNDGQSQIKTIYKTQSEILKSMQGIETSIERWSNKLNGRCTILRDSQTLRQWV